MATFNYPTHRLTRSMEAGERKLHRKVFLVALVLLDVLALVAAATAAYYTRFWLPPGVFESVIAEPWSYLSIGFMLISFCLVVFYQFQLYNPSYLLGGTEEYSRVFNACTLSVMALIGVTFFGQVILARGWIVLFWLFSIGFVVLGRFGSRRVAFVLRQRGLLQTRAVVVGADEEGRAIAEQLVAAKTCGAEVIGFLDDQKAIGDNINGLPVLGRVQALEEVVRQYDVEEVLLATTTLTRSQVIDAYRAFGASESVELRFSSGLYEILTTGVHVKEWGNVPLVTVNRLRLNQIELWLKTALDYSITIPVLLFAAPWLLLIAAAVKFTSPGPILYRRRVLGQGGRKFDALKFRTMYVNGDEILNSYPGHREELERTQKLKNDPRVTPVGNFLRKLSLDELPQLINVLMGQMSLVGPRMISPAEGAKYGKWKMNLLTVKPGISGLWQVSGRSDVSYAERIRLDMYYIRNYSIWLDLQILVRTIPAVLGGRGAY